MHNQSSVQPRQPISGVKHFWLSFLAVVTGVPVAVFIISGGFFIISIIFIIMIAASGSSQSTTKLKTTYVYGKEGAANTLISIPIRGVIVSGSAADPLQSIFGQNYTDGELVKEELRQIADENTTSGVIFEIDSPGGMITASKAIADGVEYYRTKTHKPIIAHINGTGASGAYWAAVSTDAVYAEQGSEAGSVGVIMGPFVTLKGVIGYNGTSTNEPITFKYFTAGRSKDLGSPYRDITPEESDFLNKQVQAEYEKFVAHVSSRRSIPADTIKNAIGALAYGTDDAIRLKLIDGVKSKEDSYDELARLANVGSNFQLMRVDTSVNFLSSVFGAKSFITTMRMSETDKSTARTRFCETSFVGKPLVFTGDIDSVCK
jgi:protease-4